MGRVAADDHVRATMAFEHFRQKGLEYFVCDAPSVGRYSPARASAFFEVDRQHGFPCNLYSQSDNKHDWEIDHDDILQWLSTLPRPLALFDADPYPARQIAAVCDWNNIAVPDGVAILSGDNDDLLCSALSPQLSSV